MSTTSEIMAARKTDAITAITAELWKDKPNSDTMADHAIKGGVTPAEVAELEAKTRDAKAVLAEASAVNATALQKQFDTAEKLAIAARAKADTAEQAAEKAACIADDAGRALSFARGKIQSCAQACRRGEIPREMLPTAALAQVTYDDALCALHALEAQHREHVATIKSAESLIEHYGRKIERSKGERDFCEVSPGGIESAGDALQRRLQAERMRLNNAKAGEKKTAGAIDAAKAEIEKLKSKIWKGA